MQKPTVTTIPPRFWQTIRDLASANDSGAETELQTDVEKILSRTLSKTEKKQWLAQRLGQGLFKINVAQVEKGCRLTGVTNRAHLRASHIKPWKDSNNRERLDGNNGLLLTPHVDHLFDRGLIGFDPKGRLILSLKLDIRVLTAWSLPKKGNFGPFNAAQQRYLKYHRANVFKK